MLFRRKDRITRLCRQTGKFVVADYEKPASYWVRSTGAYGTMYRTVVVDDGKPTRTRFQTFLPVGFPLDRPPSGLFARLLMRSWDLRWSAWVVNILDSCEARACVTVLVPSVALDAGLFTEICHEQIQEVAAFHKELRDKFNYAAGGALGGAGLPERYR